MIPKILHYCWFGGKEKPNYVNDCIRTWRRYFSHYQFMEWNETNVDLQHPFVAKAYAAQKWAFVSDFIRVKKLNEMGGVYVDTDMHFIKPLPSYYLEYDSFVGAQSKFFLNAGVIGCRANSILGSNLDSIYASMEFDNPHDISIPKILDRAVSDLMKPILKDQEYPWGLVLKPSVFYPLPYKLKRYHWRKFITDETIAVHLWAGSWLDESKSDRIDHLKMKVKYQISKWYVPDSFIEYAKSQ